MRRFVIFLIVIGSAGLTQPILGAKCSLRCGVGMFYHTAWATRFYFQHGNLDDVINGTLVKNHKPHATIPLTAEFAVGVKTGSRLLLESFAGYSGYCLHLSDSLRLSLFNDDKGMNLHEHRFTAGLRLRYGRNWSVAASAAAGLAYTRLDTWDFFRNPDGSEGAFWEQSGDSWSWAAKFGLGIARRFEHLSIYAETSFWVAPIKTIPVEHVAGGERMSWPWEPGDDRTLDLKGLQVEVGVSVPIND